jgi:PqqD family protein of HPr-rel-A system
VSARRWRIADGVAMRFWDDEAIVFVPASDDTHFVAAPAAELLRRLQGGAADEASLTLEGVPLGEVPKMIETLALGGIVEEVRH